MEDLHLLINTLTRAQLRVIRNYLTCFSSRGEADAKTLHLLDLLLKDKEKAPTIEECSIAIYGVQPDSKILKLKSRLKAKIFDTLLIDINLNSNEKLEGKDLNAIKLRKKMAQFHVLYFTHLKQPLVLALLDEIISVSKSMEVYSVLIEALKFKKFIKGFKIGEKEFNKLSKEIDFYEYCLKAAGKAVDAYYRMLMKTNFSTASVKAVQVFLRESISELKKDYEYTSSGTVGYYLKYLEQTYFERDKNYNLAREACIEQLAIVNNTPSLYRKQRVGIIYDNIAQFDVLLGDYSRAINNAVAAQKHFDKTTANYSISKEIEFQGYFYSKQYVKAKAISATLLNALPSQSGDFRVAKYQFFRSNVLFMLGEYKEALKLLFEKQEISKDKSGWEISIRILSILSHVELENYDYATQLIDGLRRHIDRQSKQSEIKERDRLIVKVLQEMSKRGFSQGQVKDKEISLLKQLASDDKKCKWEPLSPELIPFHEWAVKKYRINLNAPIQVKKTSKRKISLN